MKLTNDDLKFITEDGEYLKDSTIHKITKIIDQKFRDWLREQEVVELGHCPEGEFWAEPHSEIKKWATMTKSKARLVKG